MYFIEKQRIPVNLDPVNAINCRQIINLTIHIQDQNIAFMFLYWKKGGPESDQIKVKTSSKYIYNAELNETEGVNARYGWLP